MSQKRKEMSRSRSDEHDSEGPDSPTSDGETTKPIPRGATKKENEQQPGGQAERPDASAISEEQDIERRPKRKYVRGGRKKLKVVSSLLESHLPECLATNENERHLFYARVIALPEVVTAGVTREEVLSWYKRARKKVRISQLKAETMVGYTLHYWGEHTTSLNNCTRNNTARFVLLFLSEKSHNILCTPYEAGPSFKGRGEFVRLLFEVGQRIGDR